MCGIAGIVSLNGERLDRSASDNAILATLSHRGPDDSGTALSLDKFALFHHTRLAILDPTPEAAQPMRTDTSLLSFNGEIYNFRELAPRFGIPSSNSDTVVLQSMLEKSGRYALPHIEGMFAFAHYSETRSEMGNPLSPPGRILLARDPFGKKPLYYTLTSGRLYFASELRSLLTLLPERPPIEPKAVRAYFAFYSVPAPLTMFRGVYQLLPGSLLELPVPNAESAQYWEHSQIPPPTERWWQMPRGATDNMSYRNAKIQTRWLLERSVERRLVADVEVASLLSGGIDSNAVTAIAQTKSKTPLRSFTLGFEGRPSQDSKLAAEAAAHYKTQHQTITIRETQITEFANSFLDSLDAPTGDAFNSWLIAKAVREAAPELKVVLSGTGGDELFIGYKKFRFLGKHPLLSKTLRRIPDQMYSGKLRSLAASLSDPIRTRILFTEAERQSLLGPTAGEEEIDTVLDLAFGADETGTLQQILRLDLENYLPNMLLHDLDMTTMNFGLEARTPLLDRELALLIWQAPLELRLRGGSKQLLFDSVSDLLPKGLRAAIKQGFELPMHDWLRGPLAGFIQHARAGNMRAVHDGILKQSAVDTEIRKFERGESHYLRIWSIIVFDRWYTKTFHS